MAGLPPSLTMNPRLVEIQVLTDDGAVVRVDLPRPRGLHDLPAEEVALRARRWARAALICAAERLEAGS